MSASLMDRLGSSTFRLSAAAVSISLTGSCFSSEWAPRPCMGLSLSRSLSGSEFLARPALRPGRRAVKVGGCTNLAVCSAFAKPYLNEFEGRHADAVGITIRGEPLSGAVQSRRNLVVAAHAFGTAQLLWRMKRGAMDSS
jgi:hypothetical protein